MSLSAGRLRSKRGVRDHAIALPPWPSLMLVLLLASPPGIGALEGQGDAAPRDLLSRQAERLLTLAETAAMAAYMERASADGDADWSIWASSDTGLSEPGLLGGIPMDAGIRLGLGPCAISCSLTGLHVPPPSTTHDGSGGTGREGVPALNWGLELALHDAQGRGTPSLRRQRLKVENLRALVARQLAFEEMIEYGMRNIRAMIDASLSLKDLELEREESAFRIAVAEGKPLDTAPRYLERLLAERSDIEARYASAVFSHAIHGTALADDRDILDRILSEQATKPWLSIRSSQDPSLTRFARLSEPSYLLKTELQLLEAQERRLVSRAQSLPGVDLGLAGVKALDQGQDWTFSLRLSLKGELKRAETGTESRMDQLEQARAIVMERRQAELAMARGMMGNRVSLWALRGGQLDLARDDLAQGAAAEHEVRLGLRRQLLAAERNYASAWLDALEAYLSFALLPP